MVVRAARGDRETGTQRTLSLCQVAARTLSEDLRTRGRGAADRVSGTHPAWIRLCRCLGAHLAAGRVLRPEGPRTPTLGCRHRIPRRTSTEERTSQAQKWGMHMVSVRSAGLADSPRARATVGGSPPFSPASRACRGSAATGPASCWGRCCRRPGVRLRCPPTLASWDEDPHPVPLHLLVPEAGDGAWKEQRGRAWRTRAVREGQLAPERQRWRLQPGTICAQAEALTNLATWLPPGAVSAGPGPASALWRRGVLAAPGERGRG